MVFMQVKIPFMYPKGIDYSHTQLIFFFRCLKVWQVLIWRKHHFCSLFEAYEGHDCDLNMRPQNVVEYCKVGRKDPVKKFG